MSRESNLKRPASYQRETQILFDCYLLLLLKQFLLKLKKAISAAPTVIRKMTMNSQTVHRRQMDYNRKTRQRTVSTSYLNFIQLESERAKSARRLFVVCSNAERILPLFVRWLSISFEIRSVLEHHASHGKQLCTLDVNRCESTTVRNHSVRARKTSRFWCGKYCFRQL